MKQMKIGWKYLLCTIVTVLLFFASRYFYENLYYGEYKYPHYDAYTNYDYFTNMQVDGKISQADFVMYMKSAFVNMLSDKELVIDTRISEEVMLGYGIEPIKYSFLDIGVLAENVKCEHTYTLLENDAVVTQLLLYTGEKWEKTSVIEMFYDVNGNIIIAPEGTFEDAFFIEQEGIGGKTSYTKVLMQINEDETVCRIAERNNKTEIIIRHCVFALFLVSVGFFLARGFLAAMGALGIWMLFPLGFINQVLVALFMTICHIPMKLIPYVVISYLIAIVVNYILKKTVHVEKCAMRLDKRLFFHIFLFGIVTIFFCCFSFVILSYDSIFNIYVGKYAVLLGEINSMLSRASSYSLLTPMVEIGSCLFGIDLNYSLQPIMTVTLMSVTVGICYKLLNNFVRNRMRIMIIGVAVLAMVVNPMFFIQMFWKLNNLTLGLMMGIVVSAHLVYYKTGQRAYFGLANLFLAVITIARVESALFTAVYFIVLSVLLEGKRKEIKLLCIQISGLVTAVYVYYLLIIGNVESAFWTPGKGGAMVVLCWLVCLCLAILDKGYKKLTFISENLDIIMVICISVAIILIGLLDISKFIDNIKIYICNLGNYGGYWLLMAFVALGSIVYWKKESVIRFLAIYLISYVMLIPGLMMFRENPIRIGFGDSACRMLSHVVSVAGILYIFILGIWISKKTYLEKKKNG